MEHDFSVRKRRRERLVDHEEKDYKLMCFIHQHLQWLIMFYFSFVDILIVMTLGSPKKIGVRGAHRSLSQSRDDVSQSRQRLVDILCLVKNRPGSSGLTDLKKEPQLKLMVGVDWVRRRFAAHAATAAVTFSLPARSTR